MTNKDNHQHAQVILPETDSSPIPALDTATANRILNAALEYNKMDPSSIPVEVLQSWGNYQATPFRIAKKFTYLLIILTLLLPLLVFKPGITAERIEVSDKASSTATYQTSISGIIPVNRVTATLDGMQIPVHKNDGKEYTLEVSENGELVITAHAINGQVVSRKYEVNFLDTDKPEYLSSRTDGSYIYILVQDTFSGIDYDSISGISLVSVDTDAGELKIKRPSKVSVLKIPDNAGNMLELRVSP